ncbi:16S rRNA (guanine(527)-N(7))-methyltransferase RsmG [Roseovarius aquimarinus]|uniref:Ribosomal RNA small subunit methyltransferase G n=1 Tax=Roseovarius aquimarinus TaxID=1229156 RepID=A0ABW7I8M8_9RHOB
MSDLLANVSRETIERLRAFEALATKWTAKINLVSSDSASSIWDRHVLDSVQIYNAAPQGWSSWVDLGSGGGFPGVVIAVMVHGEDRGADVTMIESDARKCEFLRAALRETGVTATVVNKRIEAVPSIGADVVSARALADLSSLLGYAAHHLSPTGTAILPKGARWRDEVEAARSKWKFNLETVNSSLAAEAAILKIKGVSRV